MHKLLITLLVAGVFGLVAPAANAQMMGMGNFSNSSADWEEVVEHTEIEEQEGQELWDALQAEEVTCDDLSDEQFGALGEHFMGQMVGDSHAAMNAMMIQMHGADGEEEIHIAMGKRLSGCDTSAVAPNMSGGWMPMMNMMSGGGFSPSEFNSQPHNSMMNFGFTPLGGLGWIFMILWWALIIVAIVALVRWLMGQSRGTSSDAKTALDILKERYAKGEIDKEEFEAKKKDLG